MWNTYNTILKRQSIDKVMKDHDERKSGAKETVFHPSERNLVINFYCPALAYHVPVLKLYDARIAQRQKNSKKFK